MISWQLFPKSLKPPAVVVQTVAAFEQVASTIDSATHQHASNQVLSLVRSGLEQVGFCVETGKTQKQKVSVPVLFGRSGKPEKTFDADAYHEAERFVFEVEAGRAVVNNQFLKDLFQACMMQNVDLLGIGVRSSYAGNNDFETVCRFFETLYASSRLALPLKGILVLGY
jgi:hypothetical protein